MKRFPTLDPKVYELAELFLPDASTDEVEQLAGCIQEEIENWLEEHSNA